MVCKLYDGGRKGNERRGKEKKGKERIVLLLCKLYGRRTSRFNIGPFYRKATNIILLLSRVSGRMCILCTLLELW